MNQTYHCLGCGEPATADRLVICVAPHNDGEPIRGPFCQDCKVAHDLTTHDGLSAPWLH